MKDIRVRSDVSAITEADAETTSSAHQGAVKVHPLRTFDRHSKWHVDNTSVLPGNHPIEASFGDKIDGMNAEGRSDKSVIPRWRCATLEMTENGHTGLGAGKLSQSLAENMSNASIGRCAAFVFLPYAPARWGGDSLRNDDEGEVPSMPPQLIDMCGDHLDPVGNLWDEDNIRTTGDAGGERDMPGIATHHFKDHHAVMACRGRLQPIERFGGNHNSCVVSDGCFRRANVIVDGFWDAYEAKAPLLGEPSDDFETSITTDTDQPVDSELSYAVYDLCRPVHDTSIGHWERERISLIGGAENGPAQTQDIHG
jgi:hypothetical protein